MNDKIKLTFAYPVEVDGKEYAPDQTADVPASTARQLLHDGTARVADSTEKKG